MLFRSNDGSAKVRYMAPSVDGQSEVIGLLQAFADQAAIAIRNRIRPDMVFTPSSFDTHQDHKTTREETLRAFKQCTILGYEQPWNNITFNTLAFISLRERHIGKKIRALGCYETQKHRAYLSDAFIRGLALTRGVQIEERYAEAFEVIKWVMRSSGEP